MTKLNYFLTFIALAGFALPSSAADRTLIAGDVNPQSSFITGANWDDGLAPTAGNNYFTAGFLLRTPNDENSYTFAGDSLTVNNGGVLAMKGTAATCVYTFGTNAATGLTLDTGFVGMWNGNTLGVAGFITLSPNGGGFDPQANSPLNVAAQIGGSGFLRIDTATPTGVAGGRVVLLTNNTYTGGTTIDANMTLQLAGAGTLGSPTGALTLVNTNNGRGYGRLDLNGTSQTVGSLSGTGGQILNNAAGTTNTLTIGAGDNGGGDFQGVIANGNGVLALTKTGGATITLSGANTYTGGTTLSNGTLQVARVCSPLYGGGHLVLMLAATNPPQPVIGSNTFRGKWTVMAGWLAGATEGSLGTNDITVDPYYNYDSSFAGNPVYGPAVLEPKYNLNSAGALTLVNGGQMLLHQNCAFTAVTIEGTPLSAGTHFYSELAASFPNNFLPGGSGAITVQPYGSLPSVGPLILSQPVSVARYAGLTASLSVTASGQSALSYQWQKNGGNLSDTGNYSGSTTANLVITNLTSGNDADYRVLVTDANGTSTSTVAHVTVVLPEDAAGTSTLAAKPLAFYRFNDNGDTSTGTAPVYDYVSGFDGVYSNLVFNGANGISGPTAADGFTGFSSPNGAAEFYHPYGGSRVTVSPWNLQTNTVTIAAWVRPFGPQAPYVGLIFARGTNPSGLGYGGTANADGNYDLGYTWNNDGNTWSWDSGITAPQNVWSLVALTVTPTNATIYVINTNSILSATHVYAHVPVTLDGLIAIGDDSADNGNGARVFNGDLDDVAVFSRALSQSELVGLFAGASGVSNFPPSIVSQPASVTLYEHQTARFTMTAGGTAPLAYRWQSGSGGVYADLVDGGRVAGAASASLTISNLTLSDAQDYLVIITNAFGSVTSSVVTLAVNPSLGAATNITTSVIQASGSSWDTDGTWSLPGSATDLAAQYYGSTFIVQAPGGLRSPDFGSPGSPTSASFPGEVLRVEGNGGFDTTFTTAGAIRLKGGNPATVNFKKLVMAGGQICSLLNSGWPAILTGEINVISNTVVWATDDTSPRSLTIQSTLTGNGNIQYHGYTSTSTFRADTSASLNIANANNPYTGTWNVELGTLVGSAVNALGTNTITVGAQGALQTTYDINNPDGDLILNGRLNLTQNDTFRQVTINGAPLSSGTHSFTELANAYPANFPSTWTGVTGATTATNLAGSLTVLAGGTSSYPTNIVSSFSGGVLSLAWPATHRGWILQTQTNSLAAGLGTNWVDVPGSAAFTSTNITVNPSSPAVFYRLRRP